MLVVVCVLHALLDGGLQHALLDGGLQHALNKWWWSIFNGCLKTAAGSTMDKMDGLANMLYGGRRCARSTCCGWLENMLLGGWWTICFWLVGEHASGWLENMLWMVNMLLVGWFRASVVQLQCNSGFVVLNMVGLLCQHFNWPWYEKF
uniref:Candidate secreted effector n=1 Tax=Meloidogyne incognita TaxID=6306 RepID=A0A914LXH8_MELIC